MANAYRRHLFRAHNASGDRRAETAQHEGRAAESVTDITSCGSSGAGTTYWNEVARAGGDVEAVREWPDKPQHLPEKTTLTVIRQLLEGILMLSPVIFVALGCTVAALSGKPTRNNVLGNRVEAAVKLGPTLFPIVFAAIVGRSLRYLSRYLAHKETTLATLELLLASRSVWGTIECQLLLRRLTTVGVPLIILWGLSPLGGQASLRALERRDQASHSSRTLRYLLTGHTSLVLKDEGESTAKNDQIFIATITASKVQKRAPRDNWGNVRVPQLEYLDVRSSNKSSWNDDSSGWLNVPAAALPESYSSLIGIPVVGLPPDQMSSFTLESSYMAFDCAPWQSYGHYIEWAKKKVSVWNVSIASASDTLRPFMFGIAPGQKKMLATTFFLDTNLSPRQANKTREVYFGSLAVHGVSQLSPGNVSVTRCAVTETHVEVAVKCRTSADCEAVAMRRSRSDMRPRTTTPLDEEPIATLLFRQLPLVAPGISDGTTLTMRFFNDTAQLVFEGPDTQQFVDPTHLAPATVSQRLTLLLNTYHQAFLVRDIGILFGDGVPNDMARYGHDFNIPLPSSAQANAGAATAAATPNYTALCPVFCSRSSQASLTSVQQVYRFRREWLALLFVCAAVLLVAGAAGMLLGARALVPDMLGYAASMTYNNPYFALPERGGVLDAMDRARLLGKVRVRVGDVNATGAFGRIALTSRRTDVEQLRECRAYV